MPDIPHAILLPITLVCIFSVVIKSKFVGTTYGKSCTLSKAVGDMAFDCYVINMSHETKRMQGFVKAYRATDLGQSYGVIRQEAVVGKDIPIAQFTDSKALCEILRAERKKYRQKHYELTRGGIGCWLSHRNLWENVLNADKECAVIFEDDCIMARNIYAIMKESYLPSDWDVCLLGYICTHCEESQCADAIEVERFFGLHCYMINKKAIRKMLKNPKMKLVTKQIDSVMCDMIRDGELNVYALPEPVAWQNNREYKTSIQMELREADGVDVWE